MVQTRKKKKNVYAPIIGIPYQPDTPPRVASTSSWSQSSKAVKEKEDKKTTEPNLDNWWAVFLTGEGEYERRKRAENDRQQEEQISKNKPSNSNHSTNSGYRSAAAAAAVEVAAKPQQQSSYFGKPKPKSKKQIPPSHPTSSKQPLHFEKPKPKCKKQLPPSPQTPPKQSFNFEKPGPKCKKQILSSSPKQETQQVEQSSSSRVGRSASTKSYVFQFRDGSTIQKRKIVT